MGDFVIQKCSDKFTCKLAASALAIFLSNPCLGNLGKANLTPSTEVCSAYLVEGDIAVKLQTIGGPLSRTLKRTAQQSVPVSYTLQSLGFEVGQQPLKSHGAKIVSEFSYASSSAAEVTLSMEALQSYSGTLPSILLVENNKDLDWYFMSSGKYRVESFSPVGIGSGTTASFDQVLIPEVWQTLSPEERSQLIQGAYRTLRPGGTLRLTLRVSNVDSLAPELNGLLEDAGARGLFDSMKKQVDTALNGSPYKMLARIQKVSFEPGASELTSESFNEGLGPAVQNAKYNALDGIRNPSVQALFVIRKPGDGWGEWSLGY
jgi:hypothetical protein